MIEVSHLTKRFGTTAVVDDLSFTVQSGMVTGFLGPNGAGKSTTMRMMVELERPSEGQVRYDGRRYDQLDVPLRTVGAVLDAGWAHPNRTAVRHLRWIAAAARVRASRADEVLEAVGLASVADRRVGQFSLGMRQRLGLAAALVGDPEVLLLDEPVNGLDPEGIVWVRQFVRQRAATGRTVLISSHLLSEMAQTADQLVVIGRGRLLVTGSTEELISRTDAPTVRVRTPDPERMSAVLRVAGLGCTVQDGVLTVTGGEVSTDQVGALAAVHGLTLHELTAVRHSLEEAFMALTAADVEYAGDRPAAGSPGGAAGSAAGLAAEAGAQVRA